MLRTPEIEGSCDTRLSALQSAFADNFRLHGEVGAALAVTLEGRPVVDLWAGWADAAETRPWTHDTLVDVFSVGKPMAALCLLMLVEQDAVELDAPVARYWPEFDAAGKGDTTVRMVLAHRAGLPAIRRPLAAASVYDWRAMTAALAAEAPWWQPGCEHGYHVNTFGFLVGELVRRVSGESIGAYFRRAIADPLDADFHFGLDAREDARVADFLFGDAARGLAGAPSGDMVALAYLNPPGISGLGTVNTRAWRGAEIPSGNGHATARAVARIYSALLHTGGTDRIRLLQPGTVRLATREASFGHDAVLDRPSRFGLGFQLTQAERPLGPNASSYGHFGAGGSLGFADPDEGLAFAYTPNQGRGPRWQNPRNRALIDALYGSL